LVTAVKSAIASGYRHFDCAYIYHNEEHIGRAIRESIAESNGQLKREDFFIVSKCWNNYHDKDRVGQSIDACLARFGFDYLDLYLIHWPMGFKVNNII
jgi:diketogulonate reductase-like aldo/keto reductase